VKFSAVPERNIEDSAEEATRRDLTVWRYGIEITKDLIFELQDANLTKLAISRKSRIGTRSSFGRFSRRLLAEIIRVVHVDELGRDRRKTLLVNGDRGDEEMLWPRLEKNGRSGERDTVPRILFAHSSELKLSMASMEICSICRETCSVLMWQRHGRSNTRYDW
jgi:hypothetical protein